MSHFFVIVVVVFVFLRQTQPCGRAWTSQILNSTTRFLTTLDIHLHSYLAEFIKFVELLF